MAFLVIVMNHCGRSCKAVDRECQERLHVRSAPTITRNEEFFLYRPLITGVRKSKDCTTIWSKFYLLDDVMLPKTVQPIKREREWACTGRYHDYDASGDERGIP